MNYKHLLIITLISFISCKDEPVEPEMNCDLNDSYNLSYHSLKASKVFDIRTDPPKELRNGLIEYELSNQWYWYQLVGNYPFPYAQYFIDSILFLDASTVRIRFSESNPAKIFTYTRNDCSIDLTSAEGNLHLELTKRGEEITEQRFAIYDHSTKGKTVNSTYYLLDTFSFIEFRLGPFSSYEEIIKEFAKDNPGIYDTIGVEIVQNKTRE